MTMMREKAVKDLAQFNTEMKELERVIAHEWSLKEFMTTKCSERSGQEGGQETGHRQSKAYYAVANNVVIIIKMGKVTVMLSVMITTLAVIIQWGIPTIISVCFMNNQAQFPTIYSMSTSEGEESHLMNM